MILSPFNARKKFFGKAKYFDFARRRKPSVILHDFISGILTAVWGVITSAIGWLGSSSMVGVYAGGTLYGVTGALVGKVLIYAGMMAASVVASSLMTKSGKQNSLSMGGLLQNTSMVIDPIRPIYGKTRVGCSQVFVHAEGGINNPNLHVIAVWGEGEVEGIETDGLGEMIWLGAQRIQDFQTFGSMSWITHEFHNGSMEQNYSAELKAHFSDWADAMRGTAYSYFQCKYNPQLYSAFPQFTCIMKGRKLFDPRDGSIAHSRNAALVYRDFKTNPRYGGGIAGSLTDKQFVIDAANWCDANGFYFDGVVADRQEFLNNLEDILLCFRAEEIWSGGFYKLLIQKYDTPIMPAFSEKDIWVDEKSRGCGMGIATGGIQDYPKRIKVTFADPTNQYIPSYCYWPEATPYEAETDKESREIILIGVADFEQALKIGKFFYLRSKFSNSFNFLAHPRAIPAEIGEMISISHDSKFLVGSIPEDWNDKILRVLGISISQNNQIALSLGDEDSSIYDTTVNVAAHTYYTSELPIAAGTPEEPTGLSATTGEDTTTAARDDAYIDLQWENVGFGFNYEVRYRKTTDANWQTTIIMDPGGMVGIPVFTGTGGSIMETGGNFTGASELNYVVVIDYTGNPSKFKWSDDGGATWKATGVIITGAWQNLNNGIKIKSSSTLADLFDTWTFSTKPRTPVIKRLARLPVDTVFIWQVRAGRDWITWSEWATPDAQITTWKPTAGPSMADVTLRVSSEGSVVLLEWTKVSEDPNLQSWLIYRGTTSDPASASLIDEKSYLSRSYRDSMVVALQNYYYWLKGRDRVGNVSASFSNGDNIFHVPISVIWAFPIIKPTDFPAISGAIGYTVDKIQLSNCDSSASWLTGSSVAGSIILSTETSNMMEGTGCLKVELYRYPKVRYFEGGNLEHPFGQTQRYLGQSFKLAAAKSVKAVALKMKKIGSPGDITAEIYTDSGGKPGTSLGSCTITASGISTGYLSPPKDYTYGIFSSPIALSASTKYWLVFSVASANGSNYYLCLYATGLPPYGAFGDADEKMGYGSDLGASFVVFDYYDLSFRVCVAGDALNSFFYLTITSTDISLKSFFKNYIKSSRTGGFLNQCFGETDLGEQQFAISVTNANVWELKASDITGVTPTARDGVTLIGIAITNMDEDAIFYIDDIFANVGEPRPAIRRGTALEYILTSGAFDLAFLKTLAFPFLLKNPVITYAEKAGAGSQAFTVPSGKIWILLHLFITSSETWTLNDNSMPAATETKMHFDTILAYGDHFDLTGLTAIRMWYLELDADPNIVIKTMIQINNSTTYTVPAEYTLVITRIKEMSGGSNFLVADSKNLFDCSPEVRDFVGIFDEGTILKSNTAYTLRFIGFLIPKET
jgi:hypothetical protein